MALVACAGDPGALPKVPDFTPAATTTTGIDYSEVPLAGVGGRGPTTSVVFGPGNAAIGGVVASDEGVVPGATVLVERIVSGAVASTRLVTGDDGSWSMPQVLGGRYRVRAWRVPDLAQTTFSAVFVGASESKNVQLRVREVGGLSAIPAIAPDPPELGRAHQLVVLVTNREVDADGVVRAEPQTNAAVELLASSGWRVESVNPAITDGGGRAAWIIRCRVTGRQPLAVTVGTETLPLSVPNCAEPETETTTTSTEGDEG